MEKVYSPESIEAHCYQQWESLGYFEPKGNGQSYCIMLPPPNVTGSLHMGHGFQHTIMDILTRYHRMLQDNTLWQPGTDHAGISTQLVVERNLEQSGLSRKDMTRDEFLRHVWEWKEHSGSQITQQMRRIGSSVDWKRERFTMDDNMSQAVYKVFIQLYDEGLIYRGSRLVNWDPKLGTAVSDLEVLSAEEDGFLWHIAYPVVDSSEKIIVATTRPETMLGDVAVAVHPDDERYKHLIGKHVHLPLCDRTIPIIADDYVDPTFGSGCVKITPAHDMNDYEMGKRHDLPLINIFSKKCTINKNAPIAYRGMDRFVARDQIIQHLTAAELLIKIEPHKLKIPRGEKSNVIIEPLLTDQWFVKIKPLAEPAIEAVKNGEIRFIPENWNKTYFQWMDNIDDWCISRQLWWGHQIPAWYDSEGRIYVAETEEEVRAKYSLTQETVLRQDEDVLDTWFSSALWPFATLGWPEKTEALQTFFPTSVLVTGFDIIFFWVARMIMMSLKFTGKIPFKEVLITGLIRDAEGQKMSKSKGNVLDPIDIIDGITLQDLIEKRTANMMIPSLKEKIIKATENEFPEGISAFGTDALRFTFCALASNNRNVRFDLARVAGYRNFCNKLWNASRFVLGNLDDEQADFGDGPIQYSDCDHWILSRLQHAIHQAHQHIHQYRFDLLAQDLHEFVWHEYCDWYLELVKPIMYGTKVSAAQKRGTQKTLLHVLDSMLRLLHPIMPFITETIWERLHKHIEDTSESIMLSQFPKVTPALSQPAIEQSMQFVQEMITSIRTIRSEMNVPPSKPIEKILCKADPHHQKLIEQNQLWITNLCKISAIEFIISADSMPPAATALVRSVEIFIPLAGLIDKDNELKRLNKELAKIEKDVQHTSNKLNNPNFVQNAPEDVILKEKEKLQLATEHKEKLLEQRIKIEML